jgi:phage-related minor tail protein
MTARLDTLEGITPTVQMNAHSEMHPPYEATSSPHIQTNQCKEQLGDRIDTLTNAATNIQQKNGTDKPTKGRHLTGSRQSKLKQSTRRYNKSSSSSSASKSSDSKHSCSDLDRYGRRNAEVLAGSYLRRSHRITLKMLPLSLCTLVPCLSSQEDQPAPQ